MRMAELSARSGVPIPTIRYYLREDLLPAGELTSPNQATYDESHLRSLKVVRTLIEIGGLSIARVRKVLAYIETEDADPYLTLGKVQYALTPDREAPDDPLYAEATERVDALLAERDWSVRPDNPARLTLARTLATLARLGEDDVAAELDRYAEAAESLATQEMAALLRRDTGESMAVGAIAYDVLGDAMLSAVRRLAQEAEATRQLKDR